MIQRETRVILRATKPQNHNDIRVISDRIIYLFLSLQRFHYFLHIEMGMEEQEQEQERREERDQRTKGAGFFAF